eukprot:scaffold526_cov230-Pinguiococcus_pyrenoidosus.AAC.6
MLRNDDGTVSAAPEHTAIGHGVGSVTSELFAAFSGLCRAEIVDCPGFGDTRDAAHRVRNMLTLTYVLGDTRRAKFALLLSHRQACHPRGVPFRAALDAVLGLFGDVEVFHSVQLLLTSPRADWDEELLKSTLKQVVEDHLRDPKEVNAVRNCVDRMMAYHPGEVAEGGELLGHLNHLPLVNMSEKHLLRRAPISTDDIEAAFSDLFAAHQERIRQILRRGSPFTGLLDRRDEAQRFLMFGNDALSAKVKDCDAVIKDFADETAQAADVDSLAGLNDRLHTLQELHRVLDEGELFEVITGSPLEHYETIVKRKLRRVLLRHIAVVGTGVFGLFLGGAGMIVAATEGACCAGASAGAAAGAGAGAASGAGAGVGAGLGAGAATAAFLSALVDKVASMSPEQMMALSAMLSQMMSKAK